MLTVASFRFSTDDLPAGARGVASLLRIDRSATVRFVGARASPNRYHGPVSETLHNSGRQSSSVRFGLVAALTSEGVIS